MARKAGRIIAHELRRDIETAQGFFWRNCATDINRFTGRCPRMLTRSCKTPLLALRKEPSPTPGAKREYEEETGFALGNTS
jgi:hypothetical protein